MNNMLSNKYDIEFIVERFCIGVYDTKENILKKLQEIGIEIGEKYHLKDNYHIEFFIKKNPVTYTISRKYYWGKKEIKEETLERKLHFYSVSRCTDGTEYKRLSLNEWRKYYDERYDKQKDIKFQDTPLIKYSNIRKTYIIIDVNVFDCDILEVGFKSEQEAYDRLFDVERSLGYRD